MESHELMLDDQPIVTDDSAATRPGKLFPVLIASIVFFLVGYGTAWFSFRAAIDAQNSQLEETVRTAVADAFDSLDVGAMVGTDAEPEVPAIVDVSLDDDPVLGDEDAPITIVEFSDFRCGYCGRFHTQTFRPLLDQYAGQIKFVYRDFPVVGGDRAALAAECADEQGAFWEYHDILFENQSSLTSDEALIDLASGLEIDMDEFSACLANDEFADEIRADFEDGLAYGVRGTPAFFVNGRALIGAQPLAAFQQVIDQLLEEESAS